MNKERRQRRTEDDVRRDDEDATRRSSAPREDEPVPQFGEDPGTLEPDSPVARK